MAGPAGKLKLVALDNDGPEGTSLLEPDALEVDLLPGPPHELRVDGPSHVAAWTRGTFGPLLVKLCDQFHNLVTEHQPFEVRSPCLRQGGCADSADCSECTDCLLLWPTTVSTVHLCLLCVVLYCRWFLSFAEGAHLNQLGLSR